MPSRERKQKIYLCLCLSFFALITIYFGYFYDDKMPAKALLKCVDTSNKNYHQAKPVVKPSTLINEEVLKQKIKKGLPAWAKAQIKEDLSKFDTITKNDLDQCFEENDDIYNRLIRFQVQNGQVKATGLSLSSTRTVVKDERGNRIYYRVAPKDDASIILNDLIEYLAKNRYIPDTDFVVGLFDHLVVLSNKPVPIFTFSKDLKVPEEKDLILVPDWMNLRSIYELSLQIKIANKKYPWQDKQRKLFWRGGKWDSTGYRRKIVAISNNSYPELIDAKFTNKNVPFVNPAEHLKYRYLIAIDGLRCTWERFVWHLHSNSLIFKNESTQVQWFYKGIKPYVHYIPVNDIHSLLDKIEWAEKNSDNVQPIIANAISFAEQNLELEDMYHYYIVLIGEYTKKLKLTEN